MLEKIERQQPNSETRREPTMREALEGFAMLPRFSETLTRLERRLSGIEDTLARARPADPDRWMDTREACEYMSVSKSTFEKYRYRTNPKIKGYNLGGKVLFKKADLDSFVRLYEAKSNGLG